MSVLRENRLENSPYSQSQVHSRRDVALKRAATFAKKEKERLAREATEMRLRHERELQRHREERHREERYRDERRREDRSREERQREEKHREDRQIVREISDHRPRDGSESRILHREHTAPPSTTVPVFLRPQPEMKPILKGHVTVDTSKARGNIDVVRISLQELGWREILTARREPCDFYWLAVGCQDHSDFASGRINKFPRIQEMLSKINLCRTLDFMRALFPNEYDFYPKTWFLPYQIHEFSNEVRQQQERKVKPKPTYIVKPSEGSQGEGIYLIRDPQQYSTLGNRSHVVQEYLSNVFTLEKFKFDLRVYVTMTSIDPLEFYICKEGLARFSTIPYENPTYKNLHNPFMHLTNYSLNKRSSTFNSSEKEDEGSKRKLTSVFNVMHEMGYDTTLLWEKIEHIICKTLIAIAGEQKIQHQTCMAPGKPAPKCFQILGFDILLLKNLKPMLLEVNANPSLSIFGEQEVGESMYERTKSVKDEEVKIPLVRDSLLLMAPKNKYTRKRRHRHQCIHQKRSADGETAIVIKMDEMNMNSNLKETAIRITDSKMDCSEKESMLAYQRRRDTVKETAIRIIDSSMDVDSDDKKEDSDAKTDDGDDKQQDDSDERGTDSENKMDEEESGKEEEENEQMDDDKKKDDEDDNESQSCLKKIFPDIYGQKFEYLRFTERLASLFMKSLGVRGAQRIGSTQFRMFSRRCRLNRHGVTNAAVDILYIDMQRKWEFTNPDRVSGLGFQGFVDACVEIARKKFYKNGRRDMLESFIEYCEDSLMESKREEESIKRKLARPPRKLLRRPVHLFQRSTITSLEEESVQELYENSISKRHRSFLNPYGVINPYEVQMFMNEKRKENYKPKPLRLNVSSDDD